MDITIGRYPDDHPDEALRGQPRTYPLQLPNSIVEREDVCLALGQAGIAVGPMRRAHGAAIGLCCPPVARMAGADYARSGYQALAVGGQVYSYLRGQGFSMKTLGELAREANRMCAESLPKEAEVAARRDFSDPSAALSTTGS